MAALYLGLVDETSNGKFRLENRNGTSVPVIEFTDTHIVIANSESDSVATVVATSGLPSLYSSKGGAYAITCNPKEQGTVVHPVSGAITILWHIEYEYTSNINPDDGGGGSSLAPESKPPVISWDSENIKEVLKFDKMTGDPIVTTADEQILVEEDIACPVLEIQRYEVWPFDPSVQLDYVNKINLYTFYGAPQGCAKMQSIKSKEEYINAVKYAHVTYRIMFKPTNPSNGITSHTWTLRLLNQGTMYRERFTDQTPRVYLDLKGKPATVNLDLNGHTLNPGLPPVSLEFNKYDYIDFTPLGL